MDGRAARTTGKAGVARPRRANSNHSKFQQQTPKSFLLLLFLLNSVRETHRNYRQTSIKIRAVARTIDANGRIFQNSALMSANNRHFHTKSSKPS
jgi:hypothetical protein